jgi:long-chain acyl-CoA synthetase
VKAYVVQRPGANLTEEIVRDHCAGTLSAYKVPRAVEFRDDLPRSAVGKALRRMLVAEELAKEGK